MGLPGSGTRAESETSRHSDSSGNQREHEHKKLTREKHDGCQEVKFSTEAREKMLRGIDILPTRCGVTLGP